MRLERVRGLERLRSAWLPFKSPRTPGQASGWSGWRALLGDRHGLIAGLVITSVLSGLTEAAILGILAEGAAALVDGGSHASFGLGPLHLTESLGVLFVFAVILAFIRLALQGAVSVIPARIAADLQAHLRREMFGAFTRASWGEQSRDREGHLQELLTGQISLTSLGALQATQFVASLMSFLVLVLSALALNPFAALIVLVAAIALFGLLRPLSNLGSRQARAVSAASLAYAGGVGESVRLAEEAHVFGAEAAERERIGRLIEGVRRPFYYMQALARLVPNVYQSLIYALVAAALAALYASGAGHVASLGAVVLLLIRAGGYGQQMQGAYQIAIQAMPYLERIQAAQRRYVKSKPVHAGRRLDGVGDLGFEDVSFAYDASRPALFEISFAVTRGETVGIVGPTGAGKSTVVQILLGLREPTSGRYLVNGTPAVEFSRDDWHKAFAYLPQEPRLLHASVTDNIRFFRDLSDDAIERAARLAGIHADIMNWPNCYETLIGPRADALSGGQQQRICLARALAAQPEVLVLDEPTSALDPQTESEIQKALSELKHELTLFVVAHRMTTLDICERVMVIVDGRVQAFDTATALRSRNDYYQAASSLSALG